jgi:tetratricopeptide (TPR) repeat protein
MTQTKTFRLLSLGHRGVGKTVFLASNCTEVLRPSQEKNSKQTLWFECQDNELKENIEKLVEYTVRTGQYPPPTFKISDFCFSLKRKALRGDETLCNFSWFDVPGELCDISNIEFQTVLLSSHGCCVFVDSYALLHDENYLQTLEQMLSQLEAIVSLVNQHNLKYPFSLICTKCDLLEQTPIQFIQLEEKLRPLTKRLDLAKARYRQFYAAVPIVHGGKAGLIQSKGSTAPLLWLISELNQIHGTDAQLNLGNSINQMLTTPDPVELPLTNASRPQWQLSSPQKMIAIALAACGLLAAAAAIALNSGLLRPQTAARPSPEQRLQNSEQVLQRDPTNRAAVSQMVYAYLELGQSDKAIAQLKKSVQQSPNNIDMLFELASLYNATLHSKEEEAIYDQILNQQNDNVVALMNKASLRKNKGDLKTAKALFEKAEKYATTDELKSQIKRMAEE